MENKTYVGDTCKFCLYNSRTIYANRPVTHQCFFTDEFHLGTDKCNVECEIFTESDNTPIKGAQSR